MTQPRTRVGAEELGPILEALSDPNRRLIFEALITEGPTTATALTSQIPISRQAVSKHLAQLADVGLAQRRPQGRESHYRANPEALTVVTEWIKTNTDLWSRRLKRLSQALG